MRYLIGLALALALAACGTQLDVPTTISFAVLTPTPRYTQVPPSPTALASGGTGAMVRYERTGCFDGVQDRLTVFGDGRLEYVNRLGELKQGVATLEQIRDLELKLKVVVGVSVMPAPVPADGCVYSFRSTLADGRQLEVTTSDGAQHPQVILDVVAALEALRRQTT